MRALVQRVRNASVIVDGKVVGACGHGLVVLLGVGHDDTDTTAQRLWDKIYHLRIFGDDANKMNLSLADIGGEVLVVSQFTLYADCRHGRRPSFADAAAPKQARVLYERFCELAAADVAHVGCGIFGADMRVSLTNDGPLTIWLDTDDLTPKRQTPHATYG